MSIRVSLVAGALGFIGGAFWRDNWRGLEAALPMEVEQDRDASVMVQAAQFGLPGLDMVRARKGYVLSYDRRTRVPHWVLEHLTPERITPTEGVARSKCEFFEDSSVHPYFRATNGDYRGSGFDRGHLAAAGNHRAQQENLQDTFVLSNMAPQVGKGFNRDAWNKLEKLVRKKVKQYKNVYVCTGPLYLPRVEADGKKYVKYQVIGPHDVAVPTHFFKAVVGERAGGKLDLETYVMPNAPIHEDTPLKAFLVPRDVVERAAGLLLFEKLPNTSFYRVNGHRINKGDKD